MMSCQTKDITQTVEQGRADIFPRDDDHQTTADTQKGT